MTHIAAVVIAMIMTTAAKNVPKYLAIRINAPINDLFRPGGAMSTSLV
jgi:hypothetical protein